MELDCKVAPKEWLMQAEQTMKDTPADQKVEIKTIHYKCNGMYAREVFIPKGTMLSGEIHKKEHINVISLGRILVITEEGKREVKAPCTMIVGPGVKRIGYALEDTIWITFHATDKLDLEEIRKEVIAESYDDYLEYKKEGVKCLGS